MADDSSAQKVDSSLRAEREGGMKALSMEGPGGATRAGTPIVIGLLLLGMAAIIVTVLPPWVSAVALGILIAAAASFVVFMAMPRATQIGIMGAAMGISADAGFAKVTGETPITVANGLIKLADGLVSSIGLIAADAHVVISNVTPYGVWSFILSFGIFMGLSFLVKHDG